MNMLLNKANEIKNELYNLKLKSMQIQAKIQCDIDFIKLNIDSKLIHDLRLQGECSIDKLISNLKELKQELAEVKAFLAEVCKHSKDAPLPNITKLISQKIQLLINTLFYKKVSINWARAEVKSHFEREKLLKETIEDLAKLNVYAKHLANPKYIHAATLNRTEVTEPNVEPDANVGDTRKPTYVTNGGDQFAPDANGGDTSEPASVANGADAPKPTPGVKGGNTCQSTPGANGGNTLKPVPGANGAGTREPALGANGGESRKPALVHSDTSKPMSGANGVDFCKPMPEANGAGGDTCESAAEANGGTRKIRNVRRRLTQQRRNLESPEQEPQQKPMKPSMAETSFTPSCNTEPAPEANGGPRKIKDIRLGEQQRRDVGASEKDSSEPWLCNMVDKLSELSCGAKPLPTPTFEHKAANIGSETNKPNNDTVPPNGIKQAAAYIFCPAFGMSDSSGPTEASHAQLPPFSTLYLSRTPRRLVLRRVSTSNVQFKPVVIEEDISTFSQKSFKGQCITLMKEYEDKSLEELRLEYYNIYRRFTEQQTNEYFNSVTSGAGTTIVQFRPMVGEDMIFKAGASQSITTSFQCITLMKEYEDKSLEELRFEDYYVANRLQHSCVFVFGFPQQNSCATSGAGTTLVQFRAMVGDDVIVKADSRKTITVNYQCITLMKEYEDKSLEELRLEYYNIYRRFTEQQTYEYFNSVKRIQQIPTPHTSKSTQMRETPTQTLKTPKKVPETPTQTREAPTKAPETPTQRCEIPTKAQETPTLTCETPTHRRETPTQRCETPTKRHDTPTQTHETPTQRRETPTQRRETPTQRRETPTKTRETPTQRLAEEKKEAGDRFCEVEKYEEAVKMYREASKLCPESPVYLTNSASALMKLRQHREALEASEQAVVVDPTFTAGYVQIARCCLALGDVASGERAVRRANELTPSSADIEREDFKTLRSMQDNARKLIDLDNPYDALSGLNFCLKHYSPSCSKTKLMKAECLANMRKYEEARNIAIPLSTVKGFDADAVYVLGLCSYHQDNDDLAIKRFQNALHLDPDHKKAKRMYLSTKTRRNNKEIKLLKDRGNAAFKNGNLEGALNHYNKALKIDKNNTDENAKLHFNTATVYAKLNQTKKAAQACTAALELNENYVKALMRRAQCYTELKKYEEAMEDYETLHCIEPNDENKRLLEDANKAFMAHMGSNYHYKVLGVSKYASVNEIKSASRKLSLKYHPDKNVDASKAVLHRNQRKFREVRQALEVLSDPTRRATYDRYQNDEDSDSSDEEEYSPKGGDSDNSDEEEYSQKDEDSDNWEEY